MNRELVRWLERPLAGEGGEERGRTSHIRIIKLHIPTPRLIQHPQFLSVRLRNIGKILRIIGIHIFGIRIAGFVTKMIPIWCSQGEFGGLRLFWRTDGLEILEFGDVGGPGVSDFSNAEDGFGGELLGFFVEEGGDIWDVGTEEFWVWVTDFLESFKTWEEGAPPLSLAMFFPLLALAMLHSPKHMPPILSIRNRMEPKFLLDLNNLLDVSFFKLGEFFFVHGFLFKNHVTGV